MLQAFSELERLRPHIAKHSSGVLGPGSGVKKEPEDNNNDEMTEDNTNREFGRARGCRKSRNGY